MPFLLLEKLDSMRHFVCSMFLFFGCYYTLFGQNISENYIILRNGDVIRGDLVKVSRGDLYFDGDETGVFTVDLEVVKELVAHNKNYVIETGLKSEKLVGKISKAGMPGYLIIESKDDTSIPIEMIQITYLYAFEETFKERLSAGINLGYSFTKSSNASRVNFSNRLQYKTSRWDLNQTFSTIATLTETSRSIERANGEFMGVYHVGRTWFTLASFRYQRLLELNVDSRFIGTLGVGKNLIRNNNINLLIGTGISAQKELLSNVTDRSDLLWELPFIINFDLFDLGRPDIDVSTGLNYFQGLTQSGRARLDYNLKLSYELLSDIHVSLEGFLNLDSSPLLMEDQQSDVGVILNFGFDF